MENTSVKGIVFNIERCAVEDGPGIRTNVFLKGCPLSCKWCANPESQRIDPQVIYYANKCVGCERCINKCPHQAIKTDSRFGLKTDYSKCTNCGLCTSLCYYDAREMLGAEMTVDEVLKEVLKDKLFFERSGGGVTITGGEPMAQSDFVKELTRRLKEQNINTAIETSGYAPMVVFKSIVCQMNLVFIDIKHIDTLKHKEYTGVDNQLILSNILELDSLNLDYIIRVPLIPGVNDDVETQRHIYNWVSKLKNILWLEILPYHRLGINKYAGLGYEYDLGHIEPQKRKDLKHLIEIGKEEKIEVRIGAT